jgi:hypothetical protein
MYAYVYACTAAMHGVVKRAGIDRANPDKAVERAKPEKLTYASSMQRQACRRSDERNGVPRANGGDQGMDAPAVITDDTISNGHATAATRSSHQGQRRGSPPRAGLLSPRAVADMISNGPDVIVWD